MANSSNTRRAIDSPVPYAGSKLGATASAVAVGSGTFGKTPIPVNQTFFAPSTTYIHVFSQPGAYKIDVKYHPEQRAGTGGTPQQPSPVPFVANGRLQNQRTTPATTPSSDQGNSTRRSSTLP